jgi:hypothetical protein
VVPRAACTPALQARAGVQALARRPSHADGLRETASGAIYLTAPEREGIDVFDPATGLIEEFVRDPRVQWPDTMAVGRDGRLYVTVNQYWLCVAGRVGARRTAVLTMCAGSRRTRTGRTGGRSRLRCSARRSAPGRCCSSERRRRRPGRRRKAKKIAARRRPRASMYICICVIVR